MKSLYPGHFKPSDSELKKMWDECVFVFDTNVFLNLYRYSEVTQKELFSIMGEIKDRMWIPRKVADEFMDRRLGVLGGQIKEYENIRKPINDMLSKFENPREHPFVSSELLEKMKALFSEIQKDLEFNEKKLLSKSNNDEILQELGELTEGRVGESFTPEELNSIYEDGDGRMKNNIPPGFIDAKEKAPTNDKYRIYGDLIIWKQILLKAKKDKVGIIFVSDDKKEDWWLYFRGQRISPLPNLFQEFFSETSQSFYMYTVDGFVQRVGEFRKKPVAPEVIQETIDVRETRENWLYKIIEEQELISILSEYESFVAPSYVGLKIFVTSVLAKMGYEINHSYAIINSLVERGIIRLSEKPTEAGTARAISLEPIKSPPQP